MSLLYVKQKIVTGNSYLYRIQVCHSRDGQFILVSDKNVTVVTEKFQKACPVIKHISVKNNFNKFNQIHFNM